MDNNGIFAHKATLVMEDFYKFLIGEKKIKTKKEKKEFEASYFAMCLLLPRNSFLQMIEFLGGIEKVKSNPRSIAAVARFYNVDEELVVARLVDVILQEKENENITVLKR